MKIEHVTQVTQYRYKGKLYPSIEAVQRAIDDELGAWIDAAPVLLGPGDRIKLHEYIKDSRAHLASLLTVDFSDSDDLGDGWELKP